MKLEAPEERILDWLKNRSVLKEPSIFKTYVEKAVEDAYQRLIKPSIENEIRSGLTETASEQAIKVFAKNLRNLLLQPPVRGRVVLGLDPAYRTGVKLAVVDQTGKVLHTGVIYPTPPQSRTEESGKMVKALIEKYGIEVIAIGNGTASRETEIFTAGVIREMERGVKYMVVNEAERRYTRHLNWALRIPGYDVSVRSAISIANGFGIPGRAGKDRSQGHRE